MYTNTARRPSGTIIIASEAGELTHDTLQCCHCGQHWAVVKGSGRKRGFCMKCMRPTCGCQACDSCTPYEKRIEQIERGIIH